MYWYGYSYYSQDYGYEETDLECGQVTEESEIDGKLNFFDVVVKYR